MRPVNEKGRGGMSNVLGPACLLCFMSLELGGFMEPGEKKGGAFPPVDKLPAVPDLPDPFVRSDGTRVRTRGQWLQQRKDLLARVLHYEYGSLLPVPKNMTAQELGSKKIEATDAMEKEVLLTMWPDNA